MKIYRLGENLFEVKAFWLRRSVLVRAILEIQTTHHKTITVVRHSSGWSESYLIITC